MRGRQFLQFRLAVLAAVNGTFQSQPCRIQVAPSFYNTFPRLAPHLCRRTTSLSIFNLLCPAQAAGACRSCTDAAARNLHARGRDTTPPTHRYIWFRKQPTKQPYTHRAQRPAPPSSKQLSIYTMAPCPPFPKARPFSSPPRRRLLLLLLPRLPLLFLAPLSRESYPCFVEF
jgi:hypothetical protein